MKAMNYTPEQTASIVAQYLDGATLTDLATRFGKSAQSIMAKLVAEKVYISKAKAEAKPKTLTKAVIVANIAQTLGIAKLDTMEKMSHAELVLLAEAITLLGAEMDELREDAYEMKMELDAV